MAWSNKGAFVTGASSGIGRRLAIELACRGAAVGLVARRGDLLNEIVNEIEAAGGRALALPADVTDSTAVRSAADQLSAKFGPIDVLFANAGVGATTHAKDLDAKQVAGVIDVNIIGVVNSVTAVIPGMVKRGRGQLVAISSLAAYRGLPKSAAYCASKAAVSAFFESLRLDLHGSGIDVTIIQSGFITTTLTEGRHSKLPGLVQLTT